MIVRVGMAPRAAGLSYEQFADHWRDEHAAVAGQLPGARSYVQNHAVLADGRPLLGYPGFDACSQIEYDDLAAMEASFAVQAPDGELRRDERRLIDTARLMLALCKRRVIDEGDPGPGAVKLMSFLRAVPGVSLAGLAERVDEINAAIGVADGLILRRERLTVDPEWHAGRAPAPWDLAELLWFADADAANRYMVSGVANRGAWSLSAVGQVVGRRLATEVWVIRR